MHVSPLGRVTTIVLNWNGKDDTLACLRFVAPHSDLEKDVLVVDNASVDGSVQAIRSAFPGCEVIEASRNLGYAGGINLGVRRALEEGADWVFLLNNDAFISPSDLSRLVDTAGELGDAAAVCPLVVFAHDPELIWFAGGAFDPSRGRSGRVEGYRDRDVGQYSGTTATHRVTGAAVLMRAKALRDVGLFDDRLFFQFEDVDWALRARAAGWRVYLAPEVRIAHVVAATSGGERSPLGRYYAVRNHLVVLQRHHPLEGLRRTGREAMVVLPALASALTDGPSRLGSVAASLHGWLDYRRDNLGEWSGRPWRLSRVRSSRFGTG